MDDESIWGQFHKDTVSPHQTARLQNLNKLWFTFNHPWFPFNIAMNTGKQYKTQHPETLYDSSQRNHAEWDLWFSMQRRRRCWCYEQQRFVNFYPLLPRTNTEMMLIPLERYQTSNNFSMKLFNQLYQIQLQLQRSHLIRNLDCLFLLTKYGKARRKEARNVWRILTWKRVKTVTLKARITLRMMSQKCIWWWEMGGKR
jgi:hypothetical protein